MGKISRLGCLNLDKRIVISRAAADPVVYIFLECGIADASIERAFGTFGLMAEPVQQEDTFRVNHIGDKSPHLAAMYA